MPALSSVRVPPTVVASTKIAPSASTSRLPMMVPERLISSASTSETFCAPVTTTPFRSVAALSIITLPATSSVVVPSTASAAVSVKLPDATVRAKSPAMSKPVSEAVVPTSSAASVPRVTSSASNAFTVTEAPDIVVRSATISPVPAERLSTTSDFRTMPLPSAPIPPAPDKMIAPLVSMFGTSTPLRERVSPSRIWPPAVTVIDPEVGTVPPPVRSSAGLAERIRPKVTLPEVAFSVVAPMVLMTDPESMVMSAEPV